MRTLLVFLLAILLTPAAPAADAPQNAKGKTTVPAPPPPPENYNPPAAPEPPTSELPETEITITTKGTEIHEEYRMHGRLYMVKVIPAKGKPYYLIDHEGRGEFRRSDFEPRIAIPTWVIKRF